MTECKQETFAFTAHFSRRVEAGFTGRSSVERRRSLLLRETDRKINLLGVWRQFIAMAVGLCWSSTVAAVCWRSAIYGLALGYED